MFSQSTQSTNDSSDVFGSDDGSFLEALRNAVLPGDVPIPQASQAGASPQGKLSSSQNENSDTSIEAPSCAQPSKRRLFEYGPPAALPLSPNHYGSSSMCHSPENMASSSRSTLSQTSTDQEADKICTEPETPTGTRPSLKHYRSTHVKDKSELRNMLTPNQASITYSQCSGDSVDGVTSTDEADDRARKRARLQVQNAIEKDNGKLVLEGTFIYVIMLFNS
jgi:hypothetical protein